MTEYAASANCYTTMVADPQGECRSSGQFPLDACNDQDCLDHCVGTCTRDVREVLIPPPGGPSVTTSNRSPESLVVFVDPAGCDWQHCMEIPS
jgi:hypothetical protein